MLVECSYLLVQMLIISLPHLTLMQQIRPEPFNAHSGLWCFTQGINNCLAVKVNTHNRDAGVV